MKQEIKIGMTVRHKYIPQLLTVAADEKGPAYTGNEFEENEISLSHAIREYENGDLSIVGETQKEMFTPGEWSTSFDTQVDYENEMIDIHAWDGKSMKPGLWIASARFCQVSMNEAEANAALIAQAKNMYYALQKCVDIFKQLADDGKYPDQMLTVNGGRGFRFITDILQKANPQI